MFARSSSAFLYVLLALTAFVATTCASHTSEAEFAHNLTLLAHDTMYSRH